VITSAVRPSKPCTAQDTGSGFGVRLKWYDDDDDDDDYFRPVGPPEGYKDVLS
jgi:hypothetical protein